MISDYINESLVLLDDIKEKDKKIVIETIAQFMSKSDKIKSKDDFLEEILRREEIETTGIGNGVAFPHARTNSVSSIVIGFARSKQGVNFRAIDGKPVNIFFMIGTPKKDINIYLKILSKISRLMKDVENRKRLIAAQSAEEIIKCIEMMDQ